MVRSTVKNTFKDACKHHRWPRHYFRSPSPDEFWVVSLQQAAAIERPTESHPRHRPDALAANRVTAVLPFSLSRIHALPVLCATWHGPVSVALYVPMMDDSIHLPHHPLHGASLDAVEQHMRDVVAGLPGECCHTRRMCIIEATYLSQGDAP